MAKIIGKTVYILGAGASVHAGAPLLSDFLSAARAIKDGRYRNKLVYKDSFEAIFQWLDQLRSVADYIDLDRNNLEHIFSLAAMKKQIGLDGDDYVGHLTKIVLESLDWSITSQYKNEYFHPNTTYSNYVKNLEKLNEDRQNNLGQPYGQFQCDSIITFNYDVLLDHAFMANEISYKYFPEWKDNAYKLLKLHGSINWGTCHCSEKEDIQIIKKFPMMNGEIVSPFIENGNEFPFRIATRIMKKTKCRQCTKDGVLEPYIIPPTWSKIVEHPQLVEVWRTAVEEVKGASQLIVIGYSMPQTDTFFQYLLTLGLWENGQLDRVMVINADRSSEFKDRYRKIFSRNMSGRGKLIFKEETFEDYVEGTMMKEVAEI